MHENIILEYQNRTFPFYSDSSKKESVYSNLYHLSLSLLLDNHKVTKQTLEYLNNKTNEQGFLNIDTKEIKGNHSQNYINLHMSSIFYQTQDINQKMVNYLHKNAKHIQENFINLDFSNAWSISNELMAWSTLFARYAKYDDGKSLENLAKFLLSHDSFQKGLWVSQSKRHRGTINSIAATFHYLPMYMYLNIRVPGSRNYLKVINSIKLRNGFFSAPKGYACIDYDVIFLLFYFLFFYSDDLDENERRDVELILTEHKEALLNIQGSDGGFPEYGMQNDVLAVISMCIGNFFKNKDLHSLLWNTKKIYENKFQKEKIIYANSVSSCGSKLHESNIFSSWFRLLTLELLESCGVLLNNFGSLKLDTRSDIPGLGYNPVRSLIKKTLE